MELSGGVSLDLPLSQLFAHSQQLQERALALPSSEASTRARQAEALSALTRCDQIVDSLALFSSNEEADDIASSHLQYLRIPVLMADLQAATSVRAPEARLALLSQAARQYIRFLHRCSQYQILSPVSSAAFLRAESGDRTDPTTAREAKVAQFKRERELKGKLAALREQGAARGWVEDGEDSLGGHGVDEESEREAWLAQLDLDALHASAQLAVLRQELGMLRQVAAMSEGERRAAAQRPAESSTGAPPAPDALRELLAARQLLGNDREAARKYIFQPSHNLPTRSLAEQADIEIAQAQEAAEASRSAEAHRANAVEDEDADEAVFKARAKDDWKDEHPSGYGNSKLRPTA